MNLFALTSISGARILRFPLSASLQKELPVEFAKQREAFLSNVVDTIPFDGRYRPEEGELLVIKGFVDVDGLDGAIKNPLSVETFEPKVHSLDAVKAIFTGLGDGTKQILIQFFERRRLLSSSFMPIFYSRNTFEKMDGSGLMLDNKLLAVIDGDELKFQSFHFLRQVFELDDYFKEATNAEVDQFASHSKLSISDMVAFKKDVSAVVRRKIGYVLQSGVLDKHSVEQIIATAQMFKVDIQQTDDGKIVIPGSPRELRRMLRFLDEDYYQSPLSQTHYISNSKRVAD